MDEQGTQSFTHSFDGRLKTDGWMNEWMDGGRGQTGKEYYVLTSSCGVAPPVRVVSCRVSSPLSPLNFSPLALLY